MPYLRLCVFCFLLAALPVQAQEISCPDCIVFPKDAGALNVRDFGAKGDGVTDDTAAINAALAASGGDTGPNFWQDRIVYLPAGTYLVSSPLLKRYSDGRFGSGSILMGERRDKTIIRLKDKAAGYEDTTHPQAIIFTTAKLLDGNATSGGKDYTHKGEGNDAYMNFVENLTVDAGKDNPGAIGIDYLANNMGALRHVRVYASSGSGAIGISLMRKWPGPALLHDVEVDGFDIGIAVDNTEYSMTLDSVILRAQRRIGLSNNHNMVSVHDLTIVDAPLALANLSADGLIVIEDGIIKGAGQGDAISNDGTMTLRNLAVEGYKSAFGQPLTAALNGVYKQQDKVGPSDASRTLPVEPPPATLQEPPEQWASVASYGAVPDGVADATASIRKAFASGARTIYFPHGMYHITDNLDVPPNVERIVGMTSTLRAFPQTGYDRAGSFSRDQGIFRLRNVRPLTMEKLAFDNSWHGDQVAVEASGTGSLFLKDIVGAGVTTLLRPQNGGKVFMDNTSAGSIKIVGGKGVWARQLNSEGGNVRIENDGAPLWILGVKTEGDCTVLKNSGHARTEILGGLLYIVNDKPDPVIPAFINIDSELTLSYVEEAFNPRATYSIHVQDTENGITRNVNAEALPKRNVARMVPALSVPQ